MNEPTHIDLFSGIGGFALAARWAGFRTIGFCEIDKYCRKDLVKNFWERRQGEGSPELWSNIFDFDGTQYKGCDLITGGFPCQPFSVAGQQRGSRDDRHLWPEMRRVINEARPAWILGENVPGIIPMELDNVLSDLEGIGYACRPLVVPACAVDAKHRRDRIWIIGRNICNPEHAGLHAAQVSGSPVQGSNGSPSGSQPASKPSGSGEQQQELADATEQRLEGQQRTQPEGAGNRPPDSGGGVPDSDQQRLEGQWVIARRTGPKLCDFGDYCRWEPEPNVGRVAHGIPSRVDRLKGLGNAIVPQVAYEILREIRKLC